MRSIYAALIFLMSGVCTVQANDTDNRTYVAMGLDRTTCEAPFAFQPIEADDDIDSGLKFFNTYLDQKYGKNCKLSSLRINGEITNKTLSTVYLIIELLKFRRGGKLAPLTNVHLNSPGGLVIEALKIGDLIANNGMAVAIDQHSVCFSSCVFIYAAGALRISTGDIGIHRPFASEISTASLKYSEYLEKYKELEPLLKEYFGKYGVSPAIVDQMNVIPSDDIKILDNEEIDSYGLGVKNVAATEFKKAKKIQVCGAEYYELEVRYNAYSKECHSRIIDELYRSQTNVDGFLDLVFDCNREAAQAIAGYSQAKKRCDLLMDME